MFSDIDKNIKALLDRSDTEDQIAVKLGFMQLEAGNWDAARDFFKRAINSNIKCALAYLGLACVDYKSHMLSELLEKNGYADNANYKSSFLFFNDSEKSLSDSLSHRQNTHDFVKTETIARVRNQKTTRNQELNKLRERNMKAERLLALSLSSDGTNNFAALKADGSVLIDGYTVLNRTDIKHVPWQDIISLAWTGNGLVGLRSDGTVCFTSPHDQDRLGIRYGWNYTRFSRILNISDEIVGINKDGSIHTGRNGKILQGEQNIISVAFYNDVIAGLRADGTIASNKVANRYNGMQIREWEGIASLISTKRGFVGLRTDGTLITDYPPSRKVEIWNDVLSIATDGETIIVIKKDGTVDAEYSEFADDEVKRKYECVQSWQNMVAVVANSRMVVGIGENGYLHQARLSYISSLVDSSWKLFDNLDELDEESETKRMERAREAYQKLTEEYNSLIASKREVADKLKGLGSGLKAAFSRPSLEIKLEGINKKIESLLPELQYLNKLLNDK